MLNGGQQATLKECLGQDYNSRRPLLIIGLLRKNPVMQVILRVVV